MCENFSSMCEGREEEYFSIYSFTVGVSYRGRFILAVNKPAPRPLTQPFSVLSTMSPLTCVTFFVLSAFIRSSISAISQALH